MFLFDLLLIIIGSIVFVWFLYRTFSRPSHDRAWVRFHNVLPYVVRQEDGSLLLHNLRSARYRAEEDYDVSYRDVGFDPRELARVWFMIEPYKRGQAHTLLSFEFNDGRCFSVSVEVRKTNQKSFKAWVVALLNYEIFYVVADEQDVIYLRTNIRKDPVMFYPLKVTQKEAESILSAVVDNINAFYKKPMFYRILTRNCTSVPMQNIRKGCGKVPSFDWRYMVTSKVDEVLYEAGLIDIDMSLSAVRKRYFVTDKAQELQCDELFSRRIRDDLPVAN